ncbi:Protein MID1-COMPLEMENTING ACTIVITY 1 [Vigna angularis]|uniref:Protein MID1-COMPLEMENTING ACTIVITY 1 n=1 Tax=Phaseolus angularis TaxID=3914 RepID=A0A8T0KUJ4_PHAAN|nr:Protein MID1-COMPLEMENTING ACTIVITY 1 [Vigna angularis]
MVEGWRNDNVVQGWCAMLMANWRKGFLVMGCSDKACTTIGSLDNKNNKHRIEDGGPSAGSRVERNEGDESGDNANAHSKNYKRLVEQVRIIGNLLATLESVEVARLLETKELWDGLQEALRKAVELVESCKDKSYLYMLAMGWSVVNQFRHIQTQIDRHLQLVPLISAVHDFHSINPCIMRDFGRPNLGVYEWWLPVLHDLLN